MSSTPLAATSDADEDRSGPRPPLIKLTVDGRPMEAYAGETIAAALIDAGTLSFRETASGERRGVYCGMGICFDCLVTVDRQPNLRACTTKIYAGMTVLTGSKARQATLSSDNEAASPPVTRRCDIVIIGAGAAGLAAAKAAGGAGADVVVIDEGVLAGGQYFKQAGGRRVLAEPDMQMRRGQAAIAEARLSTVEIISNAVAWGAFPDKQVAVLAGGRQMLVEARQVILATGAYELPAPLPGWTLPGVMTTGAAQSLLRSYGVVAGKRVLVAGNGPLNLQLACELLKAGAEVAMVLESARRPDHKAAASIAAALWQSPDLMTMGLGHLRQLRRHGVPVLYGHRVKAIEGRGRVESAVIGPVTAGRARHDTTVSADIVCLGYGFLPSTELARQLGCSHHFEPRIGALVPDRNQFCETSIPGIFVAGDGAGLGGARVASEEGALAGLAAASNVGKLSRDWLSQIAGEHQHRLARHRKFQKALWQIFAAEPPPLPDRDETVICRCEDVRLIDLRGLLEDPAATLLSVKARSRLGMGRCQGRHCVPTLARLLARTGKGPSSDHDFPAPRLPAKPIRISTVVSEKPDWGLFVSRRPPSTVSASTADVEPDARTLLKTEILIVGGGIIGCSLAYFLASAGAKVCLVERGELSGQASSRNAGSFHVQLQPYQVRQAPEKIRALEPRFRLVRAAMRFWQELAAELGIDIGLKLHGGVVLADTADDFDVLQRKVDLERSWGLSVDLLSRTDVRRMFPHFSDHLVGGELCHDEGMANSLVAGPAIGAKAEGAGATILRNTRVMTLEREAHGFTCRTTRGDIHSERVVNAAGPWAAWVALLLGANLPVGGIGQQVCVTEPAPPMCDYLVGVAGRHLTMKQAANGSFLIGGGWFADIDPATGRPINTRDSIEGNLWIAQRVLPALGKLHLVRTWAGISPLTRDNNPIIGEMARTPGFYTCVAEAGFSVGPLCARMLADVMIGRPPEFDLRSYSVDRFT